MTMSISFIKLNLLCCGGKYLPVKDGWLAWHMFTHV